MTEYALAPTRTWDATNSPYRTPRVMLEQNLLAAYRVRSNGTMRHLELYPLDSTMRSTAEWVSDAIDFDGRSVQSVARELHISVATVRRYLEGLELTEEIEAGEWDELVFGADGQPEFTGVGEEAEDGDDSPNMVEEILDQLAGVGKPSEQVLVELEATKAAQAAPRRTRRTPQPRPIQDVVKAQGLPWPSEEERAAALAATPQRRTRTLADTVAAGTERQAAAPQGRDLHVCGCEAGGPGLHAPGAVNCTTVPVARRPRSHG